MSVLIQSGAEAIFPPGTVIALRWEPARKRVLRNYRGANVLVSTPPVLALDLRYPDGTLCDLYVASSDAPALDAPVYLLSGPNLFRDGWVCMGSARGYVGDVSPLDAFWMSEFETRNLTFSRTMSYKYSHARAWVDNAIHFVGRPR